MISLCLAEIGAFVSFEKNVGKMLLDREMSGNFLSEFI